MPGSKPKHQPINMPGKKQEKATEREALSPTKLIKLAMGKWYCLDYAENISIIP